jgi:hypothetical protein
VTEEEYEEYLAARKTDAEATLDGAAQLRERADRSVAAEESRS